MLDFIIKILTPNGGVSSKRVYSGLLILSGIIYGCCGGNPENVKTFIYSGAALLGAGSFAETMGNVVQKKNSDEDKSI
jgi:hypothetical protein